MLSCLLQPALSDHTKKLVVKVPHLIKHVHHNHIKPVHIYKYYLKKDHHEYHDEDWNIGDKGSVRKHKQLGSFSHIKPIVWHRAPLLEKEQDQFALTNEYRPKNHYDQHKRHIQKNSVKKYKFTNSGEDFEGKRNAWSPQIAQRWEDEESKQESSNEEIWLRNYEQIQGHRGFSRGFRQGNNQNLDWNPTKHLSVQHHDENGFDPALGFNGWTAINDGRTLNKEYQKDQLNFSGEKNWWKSDEENMNYNAQYSQTNNKNKKEQEKNHSNKNIVPIWNLQYGPIKTSNNEQIDTNFSQGQASLEIHKTYGEKKLQPSMTLQTGDLPDSYRLQNQLNPQQQQKEVHNLNKHKTNQQLQTYPYQIHQINEWQSQQQHENKTAQLTYQPHQNVYLQTHQKQRNVPYQTNEQQHNDTHKTNQQEQHSQSQTYQQQHDIYHKTYNQKLNVPHITYQQQQNIIQENVQPQEFQSPVPVHTLFLPQSSKMAWLEHQIQIPQQAPYNSFVQQFPAPAAPVQVLPLQPLPASLANPVHQVLPSALQLNYQQARSQKPQVKQQWHQSVEMSGKYGPASSYKVEVTNYSPVNTT